MPNVRCLVALGAFVVALGCFPAKSPSRNVFECRVEALRPAVPTVLDAADLAREVAAKRVPLRDALVVAGVYGAKAEAVVSAYEACDAAEAARVAAIDAGAPQ